MKLFTIILLCFFYAVLNVCGSGLIKAELANYTLSGPREWFFFIFKPHVMLGLFVNFLSVLLIFKALALGKFTYVLPVSVGLNFLFAVLVGYFIFNDKLSFLSLSGIVTILIGIVIMSCAK